MSHISLSLGYRIGFSRPTAPAGCLPVRFFLWVDARGGGPLGDDGGVCAELVADGDVEVGDEFAGLLDLGAGEGVRG